MYIIEGQKKMNNVLTRTVWAVRRRPDPERSDSESDIRDHNHVTNLKLRAIKRWGLRGVYTCVVSGVLSQTPEAWDTNRRLFPTR